KNEKANSHKEEDEQLVRSSIEALGRSEDHTVTREYILQKVLPNFKTPNDPMVRVTMEALSRIGNAETYDALMNNTNNLNRVVIIDALAALDDIRAIDYFNNLLQEGTSNDAEIKQRIALALGRLGDASAVTPLKSWLDANTGKMRLSVVSAL